MIKETLLQDRLLFPEVLWERPQNIYKRACGKILILAGSRAMSGAALMTAEAAFRAGIGLVILGYPENLKEVIRQVLPETMNLILPETPAGTLSKKAYAKIIESADEVDLVALGPGLTRNRETQSLILKIIENLDKPLLVDADGLNAISDYKNSPEEIFKKRKRETIITPHYGEMSRLIKITAQKIEEEKIQIAREYAARWQVILVLKGHETLIAHPEGKVVINKSGTPALATAGTGDVLTGVVATLCAQNPKRIWEAAATAVYLHGLAGQAAEKKVGARSVMASDVIEALAETIKKLEK